MPQQGLHLNVGDLGRQTGALRDGLAQMSVNVQRRIGRSAVTRATRPVAKRLKVLLKAQTGETTGQAARAAGIKTGSNRSGDPYGIAGVRKGARWRQAFILPAGRRKRAFNLSSKSKNRPTSGRRVIRWPQKYFHLISKGFRHRSGKVFPGKSLMIRAWNSTKSIARRTLKVGLAEGIIREAAKIRVRTAFKGGRR